MENRCGGCTVCCLLMHVREIDKPLYTECGHCELKKGCKIYDSRPNECKTFQCLWYSFSEMPIELRPDNCGVMVEELQTTDVVIAHSFEHNAWMKEPALDMMEKLLESGRAVMVVDGIQQREKHMLLPMNKTKEDVMEELKKEYGVIYGSTNIHN